MKRFVTLIVAIAAVLHSNALVGETVDTNAYGLEQQQGGQAGDGKFLATILNKRNETVTISTGNETRQLNAGQFWQVRVSDGQTFSYHGQSRMIGPGQLVGGALAQGRFSANEAVVSIGGGGPAPDANAKFQVTIVNGFPGRMTVNVGNQSQKLNSQHSWKVNVFEGQVYSVAGEPRQIGPDAWVGGGTFAGKFTSSQRVVTLGGSGSATNPDGTFQVTIVNDLDDNITVTVGNQRRKLNLGQTWPVNVTEGQTYSGSGQARQTGPGQWVGGGAFAGTFSSSQRVVNLGGGAAPAPDPNSSFQVTIINRFNDGITVQVGNDSRKLNSGHSWVVRATEGQQYSVARDPRLNASGRWVGGGTLTGQFTSSQNVVNVGGNAAGGNNPGQQNPMADGSFKVTFTNNAAGPVVLKLFDTQKNLLETRTLQVNGSFSSTAKFGYTYEQEGPTTNFNGLITTASASGGISPTNPNISLR